MVQRELGLDGFCGRGPDEGLGVPVGGGDVADNRAFEVVDRAKDAPFEALPSELGEKAFHGIEPGAGGRREVERPSRMLGEPGQHLRMFVGGIVVEDGVDHLAGWHGPLDGCDEADELLMPMARHTAADHLAFEHAERGEQGRRAVAFVIVREGCAFPPLHWKTRLGPVERLDLAFLVDGNHHRVAGRVHVETDDIIKLGGEVGIVGSLEGPDPVRLELMSGPYALDRSQRKTHRLGDGAAGAMGDYTARFAQGALDYGMHLDLWHWRDAGRAGFVAQQALNAFLVEALPPAPPESFRTLPTWP